MTHRRCRRWVIWFSSSLTARGSRGRPWARLDRQIGDPRFLGRDPPAVDLKEEGEEHRDGCHEQPDRCVEGVCSDLPPAVRVEEQSAERLIAEESLHLAGELRVRRVRLRGSAHLCVRLTTSDLAEMDADEVVSVFLCLNSVSELLAGIH